MLPLPASPVTGFSGFETATGSPSVAELVCISMDCHNNVMRNWSGFEEIDGEHNSNRIVKWMYYQRS